MYFFFSASFDRAVDSDSTGASKLRCVISHSKAVKQSAAVIAVTLRRNPIHFFSSLPRPYIGILKPIGQNIFLDRKPGICAVFIVELLLPAMDDRGIFKRLFASDFLGDKGALADDPADRILTGLIGDLLGNQGPVTLESHINIEIDPLIPDFYCHKDYLASLSILTTTP